MKTTIEIADGLLSEAKRVANREGTTVRALVEEGLRRALEDRKKRHAPFKLRLVTFAGQGLQPHVDPSLPRDLAYELAPLDAPSVNQR
ncbi:MAG: type II toxin-antitoxin system VapB family antitoxin [Myxococcota bacterium]